MTSERPSSSLGLPASGLLLCKREINSSPILVTVILFKSSLTHTAGLHPNWDIVVGGRGFQQRGGEVAARGVWVGTGPSDGKIPVRAGPGH